MDSGVYSGYRIPPYYDSLIGKLIVHGRNRVECMMRLRRALDEFVVDGVKTTLPLFQDLIANQDIANGDYDFIGLKSICQENQERKRLTKVTAGVSPDDYSIEPELLLRAYATGIFPMAEEADDPEVFWVRPERRGVIPLDGFTCRKASRRPSARAFLT